MKGEEQPRHRIPRRWIALVIVVAAVVASERWNGPLTLATIRSGTTAVAGAMQDRLDPAPSSRVVGTSSDAEVPEIHLTFDDGPDHVYTAQILDLLADHDATAVFFPIGNQVAGGATLLRRAVAEGHVIGNHTWDHDNLARIDEASFERSVGRTQTAIGELTGVLPTCLRPPGGNTDGNTEQRAANAGLRLTMWTVDPSDWDDPDADAIAERVVSRAADGDIVLLHDGGGDRAQTVAALGQILDGLSDQGFRLTAVPGC